mmetsp:Transcript_76482/g.224461  ORF Transcript_76482/g.224461 Transcript_76482/m.224461 type:complete len:439 (+) Transcript_76482:38-1354(+)
MAISGVISPTDSPADTIRAVASSDEGAKDEARRTFARKESTCMLCSSLIGVGDEIWPVVAEAAEPSVRKPGQSPFSWCHVACAEKIGSGGLTRPPCPWWSRRGSCLHGDCCVFSHAPGSDEAGGRSQAAARGAKALFSGIGRAGVFRRWLLSEFGTEELARGTGVLDVAGGKGELGFELLNLSDVPCTVVDPRDLVLGEFEEKFRLGRYSSNRWLRHSLSSHYWETLREGRAPRAPGHLRRFFDHRLLEALAAGPCRGETGAAGCELDEEVADLLSDCSAVVGMHLDGAAEAVVDFALRFKKPFAIVPCCVCSKDFPRRTLSDAVTGKSRLVRSYGDLLKYLLCKDTRIRRATLDFEGKNEVLYLPPSALQPSPEDGTAVQRGEATDTQGRAGTGVSTGVLLCEACTPEPPWSADDVHSQKGSWTPTQITSGDVRSSL